MFGFAKYFCGNFNHFPTWIQMKNKKASQDSCKALIFSAPQLGLEPRTP